MSQKISGNYSNLQGFPKQVSKALPQTNLKGGKGQKRQSLPSLISRQSRGNEVFSKIYLLQECLKRNIAIAIVLVPGLWLGTELRGSVSYLLLNLSAPTY